MILGPPRGGDGSLRASGPPDLIVLCAGLFPSLPAWGCTPRRGGASVSCYWRGGLFSKIMFVRGSPGVGGAFSLGLSRLKIFLFRKQLLFHILCLCFLPVAQAEQEHFLASVFGR